MSLKAEEISNNWNKLIEIIETEFTGERRENLLKLYNEYQDRISMAPASSVDHYHNAFVGGYVDHVLRVIQCAKKVYELWTNMGADMSGYTREELIGRSFKELNFLTKDSFEKMYANVKRVMSGDQPPFTEYEFVAKDGSRRFAEVKSAPVFKDGNLIELIAILRDVTTRKLKGEL